jgi:NAD(P)-dependent dehydrogenase (short-subunit alcohol dehydrogenase family)
MSDRLTGKTALVTGAATGIGQAVATRLAREGARVVFSDRDADGAAAAAASADGETRAVTLDISDETSAPAAELDLENWRRTIDINLTGTFLTIKHSVRAMLSTGGGSIILTGSPTGINGEGAAFTAYSASKAGIHGLARTVAAAYASDNIRVNTVIPAYTETTLVSTITSDPEARAAIIGRIPLGRAGSPADIEGIVVFLASDDAAFATGASFAVDGGMTTL